MGVADGECCIFVPVPQSHQPICGSSFLVPVYCYCGVAGCYLHFVDERATVCPVDGQSVDIKIVVCVGISIQHRRGSSDGYVVAIDSVAGKIATVGSEAICIFFVHIYGVDSNKGAEVIRVAHHTYNGICGGGYSIVLAHKRAIEIKRVYVSVEFGQGNVGIAAGIAALAVVCGKV